MEKLTEYDAEEYITSQMVSFLAQSRPFGGVKSPNGMCRFFSNNVTVEQRALINNTSVAYSDKIIAYLKNNWRLSHDTREVHWFVVCSWNIRLCVTNEVNLSQYTDILKPGDPITVAVIKKAKMENVYFDLRNLAVEHSKEEYTVHK